MKKKKNILIIPLLAAFLAVLMIQLGGADEAKAQCSGLRCQNWEYCYDPSCYFQQGRVHGQFDARTRQNVGEWWPFGASMNPGYRASTPYQPNIPMYIYNEQMYAHGYVNGWQFGVGY